jgi:hypothetical protein
MLEISFLCAADVCCAVLCDPITTYKHTHMHMSCFCRKYPQKIPVCRDGAGGMSYGLLQFSFTTMRVWPLFNLRSDISYALMWTKGPKVTVKQTRGKSLLGCQGCRGFQPYGRLSLDPRCHVSLWFPVLGFGLGFCLGLIPSSEAAGSWFFSMSVLYVSYVVPTARHMSRGPNETKTNSNSCMFHGSMFHEQSQV